MTKKATVVEIRDLALGVVNDEAANYEYRNIAQLIHWQACHQINMTIEIAKLKTEMSKIKNDMKELSGEIVNFAKSMMPPAEAPGADEPTEGVNEGVTEAVTTAPPVTAPVVMAPPVIVPPLDAMPEPPVVSINAKKNKHDRKDGVA